MTVRILPIPVDHVAMTPAQRIERMAAALVNYQANATESDALRCLMARGFGYGEIVAYLDDARALARTPQSRSPSC